MAIIQDFIEERFPESISYGSSGGPQFNTNIITVSSGFEQRNINWLESRAKYSVNEGVKTTAQMEELLHFFRTVRGRAIGFRYKDWADFRGVGEAIGTGDGIAVDFQLKKTYGFGAALITNVRDITKPVQGTVTVYVDSVADPTVTIDHTTGIITFTAAPMAGAVITADFEFDVPARFNIDHMNITLDTATISSWSAIEIIEIKI